MTYALRLTRSKKAKLSEFCPPPRTIRPVIPERCATRAGQNKTFCTLPCGTPANRAKLQPRITPTATITYANAHQPLAKHPAGKTPKTSSARGFCTSSRAADRAKLPSRQVAEWERIPPAMPLALKSYDFSDPNHLRLTTPKLAGAFEGVTKIGCPLRSGHEELSKWEDRGSQYHPRAKA